MGTSASLQNHNVLSGSWNPEASKNVNADELNDAKRASALLVPQHKFKTDAISKAADVIATKIDEAAVPEHLWNNAISVKTHNMPVASPKIVQALNVIRKFALQRWKRSILKNRINSLSHPDNLHCCPPRL